MYYNFWTKGVDMSALVGETITSVTGLEKDSEEVRIFTQSGKEFLFYHDQDCCESVYLCDFEIGTGDFHGALIISAEESSNSGDEDSEDKPCGYMESFTWTFYKIETTKGEIWMRWLGESNGCYSEDVSLVWVNKPYTKD